MRDQLLQLLQQLCESSYHVADDAVYYDEYESMSFEDAFQRFSLDV